MARDATAPQMTFILPHDLATLIEAEARAHGDKPANVLADIVALHFDAVGGEQAEHEPYVVPVDDDLFAFQIADQVQP